MSRCRTFHLGAQSRAAAGRLRARDAAGAIVSPLGLKILLLQLKRIGDLVLTTPAIAAVREKFPEAEITLVVAGGCAELLPAIRGVDHAFIAGEAATWLKIVGSRFEYCVDFTHSDRSAFLTFLSNGRKRVTAAHARVQS